MTEQLIIDGQRVDASDGGTFEVCDPSTGGPLATGIYGFANGGSARVRSDQVSTDGHYSTGILVRAIGGQGVIHSGGVQTTGDISTAIYAAVDGAAVAGNGLNGLQVDSGTLTKDGFWDDPDITY